MSSRKSLLLAATAFAALGFSSTGALAFDEVDWEWNKIVDELVIKRVNINADLVPTGMVELEKLQILIGDVTATSIVNDIHNNPPAGGGSEPGQVVIGGDFAINGHVHPGGSGDPIDGLVVSPGGDPDGDPGSANDGFDTSGLTISGGTLVSGPVISAEGENDEATDDFFLNSNFDEVMVIQVDANGIEPFDAVDLPSVESVATAVGNNQQINSDVGVQLHDAQVVFNTCFDCQDGDGGPTPMLALVDGMSADDTDLAILPDGTPGTQVDGGGNLHTDIALAGSLAAILGVISPSEITATSAVFDIDNATVDSSATAVANNIGVAVEATNPGDHLVLGDITQFAFANVSASSTVNDVVISNYANMGVLDGPIVSSVATAVGNNVTVNVGVPSP